MKLSLNLSSLTDVQIWTALKKGEDWAISYIYTKYSENLYHYGLKFTSDHKLLEDVLQDLFTELIRNRRNLGNTDNVLFYLIRSFKNNLLRKIKREKIYSHNEEIDDYQFNVIFSIENEIILNEISEERSKIIRKVLSDLTSRQKEIIYLRFSKDLDYKEIALIMEISVEACRNLISKVIKKLKESFPITKGTGTFYNI